MVILPSTHVLLGKPLVDFRAGNPAAKQPGDGAGEQPNGPGPPPLVGAAADPRSGPLFQLALLTRGIDKTWLSKGPDQARTESYEGSHCSNHQWHVDGQRLVLVKNQGAEPPAKASKTSWIFEVPVDIQFASVRFPVLKSCFCFHSNWCEVDFVYFSIICTFRDLVPAYATFCQRCEDRARKTNSKGSLRSPENSDSPSSTLVVLSCCVHG